MKDSKEVPNDVDGASVHRVVMRRMLRLIGGIGGIPLVIVAVAAFLLVLFWLFLAVSNNMDNWFASIEEPTERGLAYVAVAIAFHAFYGKSDVNVKVDGKPFA